MGEISSTHSHLDTSGQRCRYCGAVLSPAFYFCCVCASPYKPIECITGRVHYEPVESERIRQKAPNVWSVFWSYTVVLFITAIFYYILRDEDNSHFYALVFGSVLSFILTAYFEVKYWPSLVVQLKQFGLFHRAALLSFAALPLLLLLNYLYHYIFIGSLIGIENISPVFEEADCGAVAKCMLICVFPAITEEIAFRGLIQHWLQTAIRPWRALVLASALFTALHVSVVSAPYLFLLGIVLGWAKMKTGSLYPSMLLHFLHNAAVIFIFPYFVA